MISQACRLTGGGSIHIINPRRHIYEKKHEKSRTDRGVRVFVGHVTLLRDAESCADHKADALRRAAGHGADREAGAAGQPHRIQRFPRRRGVAVPLVIPEPRSDLRKNRAAPAVHGEAAHSDPIAGRFRCRSDRRMDQRHLFITCLTIIIKVLPLYFR